jgi:hypothetical protein
MDGTKLYLRRKTPSPFPFQPSLCKGSMSPPQCTSPWVNSRQGCIIVLKIWIVCTLQFESYLMGFKPNVIHWQQVKQSPLIESFKGQKLSKNKVQGWTLHLICGQHWLDYCWWGQLVSIMKSLSNIQSPIWHLLPQIILSLCNIWKVITRKMTLLNFL